MTEGKKPIRIPAREGETKLRPGQYRGRNGEILTRERPKTLNKFDFPDNIKEDGYSYQWVRTSVLGDSSLSEVPEMKRAGWREVPPDALKGYFKEGNDEGSNHIVRDGLLLVERPEGMTREAQEEARRSANSQYASQLQLVDDENLQLPPGVRPMARRIEREDVQPIPQEWAPEHRQS